MLQTAMAGKYHFYFSVMSSLIVLVKRGVGLMANLQCTSHESSNSLMYSLSAGSVANRTPLHCAASCNDRNLCEFLVRNGAAVMAMTQSDGATASQKCDPYAVNYEECESFLRGEEILPTHAATHAHPHPHIPSYTVLLKTKGMNLKIIAC